MNHRVSIKTIDCENKRTIDKLLGVYSENEFLESAILKVLNDIGFSPSCFFGCKILIKPNWVRHDLKDTDHMCLTTHPQFILAVLRIVLDNKPKEVIIADAPIQGCAWEKMLPDYFIKQVETLSQEHCVPIRIIDLRRRVFNEGKDIKENIRPIENYVLFDVGSKSYLEPITTGKAQFRVTNYHPDRLAHSHSIGKHTYCIARDFFEADYVIALPKAKTHQKSGITNALKLIVGLNGDKDFLPHHRVGGTGFGGDCYPGHNPILRLSEHFLDMANRRMGTRYYSVLMTLSKTLWKSVPKSPKHTLSAGWHGNDTTWRMVMDLNLIVHFGKIDGSLSNQPEREILYLCDAIIGGQGNGPLNPDPLPLGVLMAGQNPAIMDKALAYLMRFDPQKLPLVMSALELFGDENDLYIDGKVCSFKDIENISIATNSAPGWAEYL